jgi:hypothetical protein
LYFQAVDDFGHAYAKMLTQRIGAKAPARIDVLTDVTPYPILKKRQFNSCTNRSPVAMHPFQVERYPMVAVLPRI